MILITYTRDTPIRIMKMKNNNFIAFYSIDKY